MEVRTEEEPEPFICDRCGEYMHGGYEVEDGTVHASCLTDDEYECYMEDEGIPPY